MSASWGGHRGTGQQPDVIVLGKRRRKRLERIVAAASSPQHLVLRAKIVLAAWRREANANIARDLRVCVDTVRTWRARFRREGYRPC